ncbi:unnamed protein product [Cuscuta epithymum]|uniref:Uncharacterized protein n=1 Tax=Cuscuta epithymum TaxID=186058 RepID=A0AAV0D2R3_9ASTE|nr:unnamed protein product [Cuscuta epithymum]
MNVNTYPATGPPPRRTQQRGSHQRQQQHSAQPSPAAAFSATPSSPSPSTLYDPWVIDSGATHHVTGDISKLSLSHPYNEFAGADVAKRDA